VSVCCKEWGRPVLDRRDVSPQGGASLRGWELDQRVN